MRNGQILNTELSDLFSLLFVEILFLKQFVLYIFLVKYYDHFPFL